MSVELLLSLAGTAATIIGGFWAVLVLAMKQFERRLDERFQAQEKARAEGGQYYKDALGALQKEHTALERAFLTHLANLPKEYVRREDHIRFETVITARLDALHSQMALIAERQIQRGAV